MSFRSALTSIAAAALLAAPAVAHAQTSYGAVFSFTGGSAVSPGYVTFDVLTGGAFRFWTVSTPGFDPQIFLFQGTRAALGATVTGDDDGCISNPASLCPGSTNIRDALITPTLVGGQTYTLAIGRYTFTEAEARAGLMDGTQFSGNINITSLDGTATNFAVANGIPTSSVAPEPGTWALMGTGLVGLVGVARRRRRTA